MNVLFYLTPKSQIKFIDNTMTVRQVLEVMEYHRYTIVPLLSKEGRYIGTVSEGDLLFFIKNNNLVNINDLNNIPITLVKRHIDYESKDNLVDMKSLISVATNQNFVPIVDDRENFIGIVTRKSIINYLSNLIK